jgi:hypothetical protein
LIAHERLLFDIAVDRNGSIPAIPEGQLSGIQFFDRNLNFRGPEADRHEVLFPRHKRRSRSDALTFHD